MSGEAHHDPTSTQIRPVVASEIVASILADVREWWRHPKRTAVAATFQLAWLILVDLVICFGLGRLWFYCWYSSADLSADQLGFARKRRPGDQAAWWDENQRFYDRNTFRALQMQWFWRECPLSLVICVVATYLCTKIWPRLQAQLGWFGRQLFHAVRRVLYGPPDHLVRNWNKLEVYYRETGEYTTDNSIRCDLTRLWRRITLDLEAFYRSLIRRLSPAEPNMVKIDFDTFVDLQSLEEKNESLRARLKTSEENCRLAQYCSEHKRRTCTGVLYDEWRTCLHQWDAVERKLLIQEEVLERKLLIQDEMLILSESKREALMAYTNQTIQNIDREHVRRLLTDISAVDLLSIVEFLQVQDEAVKQRDDDPESVLNVCCASVMAEPAMLILCASILAGLQAEKEALDGVNHALRSQVLKLRRTLFAFRKRTWTVAIVRDVGDTTTGTGRPPLASFFPVEKGDDTHLVYRLTDDLPASMSRNFKSYAVDDVFIAQSNTTIGGVLTPLIRGGYGKHDVCLIADGQSGSGKSYTLFNGPDALVPLIGKDMLDKGEHGLECRVSCAVYEVCQDGVLNLLGAKHSELPVLSSPKGRQQLDPLNDRSKGVAAESELRSLLTQACERRRVSATSANAVSSRGHMICTLTYDSGTPSSPNLTRVVIVDLAGSERRQNESLKDDEKAETKFINNSRTEVRRALISLANNGIPTKDSMLTKALGGVLNKNSKFIMLAHLSPLASDYGRGVDTLTFCTEVSNKKSTLTYEEAMFERSRQQRLWYDLEAL